MSCKAINFRAILVAMMAVILLVTVAVVPAYAAECDESYNVRSERFDEQAAEQRDNVPDGRSENTDESDMEDAKDGNLRSGGICYQTTITGTYSTVTTASNCVR